MPNTGKNATFQTDPLKKITRLGLKKLEQSRKIQLSQTSQRSHFSDSQVDDLSQNSPSSIFSSTPLSATRKFPPEYEQIIENITINIKQQLEETLQCKIRQQLEELFLDELAIKNEEIKRLQEENHRLHEKYTKHDEKLVKQEQHIMLQSSNIETLKKKVANLERAQEEQNGKTEHLLQEKHINVCVLSGPDIPECIENENCEQVISNLIRNKLKLNLPKGSITVASRLGRKADGKPDRRPIRFKCKDDKTKSDLISSIIKVKPRFYINEYLTQHNKSLLKRALAAKKEKFISTCYVKNGILHIKTGPRSTPSKIKSIDELESFLVVPNIPRD